MKAAFSVLRNGMAMTLVLLMLSGCTGQDAQERMRAERAAGTLPATEAPTPLPNSPVMDTLPDSRYTEPAKSMARRPVTKPIHVALLLPLSGTSAELGNALLDAALLALYDKQATLSDDEKKRVRVILMPKDTRGNVSDAVQGAQKAIEEGADIILGPVFGKSLRAITPYAQQAGIPVLSFSNDKTAAGRGVFVSGFTPDDQIRRIIRYAEQRGVQRFAALLPRDAYGSAVATAAEQTIQADGSIMTRTIYYNPGTDISTQIANLFGVEEVPSSDFYAGEQGSSNGAYYRKNKELPFEALLVPEGGGKLGRISDIFAAYSIDPKSFQLLGSGQWDDNVTLGSPIFQGGWFASSVPEQYTRYERHFASHYGYSPLRLSSLAYDAMALISTLVYDESGTGKVDAEALTNPSGFQGPVDGIFRFLPNGGIERGLAVMEVTPMGFRVIDPPPTQF